jgi:hypothetical protein
MFSFSLQNLLSGFAVENLIQGFFKLVQASYPTDHACKAAGSPPPNTAAAQSTSKNQKTPS